MAKGKTIEINGNALVDAGRLQAAALSQIEQVLAKRSLQVLRAAKDGLREYLLGDPGRKPHRFKYPISIKVTFMPGMSPAVVHAKISFAGPKYQAETEKPEFVQLDLFEAQTPAPADVDAEARSA